MNRQTTGAGRGLSFSIGTSVTLSYNITNCSALSCPFDSQSDDVTLTVQAVPSGAPLAIASGGFQLLPLAGVRGG